MNFPENFTWGAASSSYQIEGAARRGGGGDSVWDVFGRLEGNIMDGHTGEVACDHYTRYREDVRIMTEIGLQAYRFSVSWPRLLPEGAGRVNPKGLDFYNRLVDALLENNITPWLTLFHWDYPYELYKRGGWLHRDSSDWFADYAAVVVDSLSDRVSHWMTLNEPQCFIGLGHQQGRHAPGDRLGLPDVLGAAHNALLAHGKAVQVIRSQSKTRPTVGVVLVVRPAIPVTGEMHDVEAARERTFSVREKNVFNNTWFADPMLLGSYPEDGVALHGGSMPDFDPADLAVIQQPLDFVGTNTYSGEYCRALPSGESEEVVRRDIAYTAMNWPITPEALYWGPKFVHERYQLPIVVTENGMANFDAVLNGKVRDYQRIDYLFRHLEQYGRAISEGVPALGYFLWSIMDNFEWAEGYRKRFGIVYVDYESQTRTLKDSAYWYKRLIASGGQLEDRSLTHNLYSNRS